MLKKLIALGAFAAATVVPATAAQADAAAPQCGTSGYSPCIPTQTHISAEAEAPGVPVILTVSASANYDADPRPDGDIAVQVTAASSTSRTAQAVMAAPLFTTTVHFVDEPIRITGPGLPKGRYLASASFTPDADMFLPSRNSTSFGIGVGGGPGDDGDNGGAGLPDTGGPSVMWLLLGSGLVVVGGGSVTYARRRESATA